MTCEVYRDRTKQWRWRVKASNGRILADSGEAYRRHIDCVRIAVKLFPDLQVLTHKGKAPK